ncbi:hypothetical protein [Pseudacidovorax sp.]|uniref:hypothetical protein n=1 Tax=Pseudacidovorax sp. TaxID=1934311 RepID=UPI0025E85573|nr:hypothetical protein [Pseudacidovorax sp.]
MSASSPTPAERARKGCVLVARALAEPGRAAAVATLMGLSESTVSRIRNERVDEVLLFLAHLGLKVVPSDFQCVDQKTFGAFQVLWERAMSQTSAARLIFEDAD